LISLLQMKDIGELQESCRDRIEQALISDEQSREGRWTESVAVGNKSFIEATIKKLGIRAKGRNVVRGHKSYELREPTVSYGINFTPKNSLLRLQNTYFWDSFI